VGCEEAGVRQVVHDGRLSKMYKCKLESHFKVVNVEFLRIASPRSLAPAAPIWLLWMLESTHV
jgi:hypothetical protein